jgi:hypothetical protein
MRPISSSRSMSATSSNAALKILPYLGLAPGSASWSRRHMRTCGSTSSCSITRSGKADAGPPIGRVCQDSFWEPTPHRLPDREHMTARMRLPAGVGG